MNIPGRNFLTLTSWIQAASWQIALLVVLTGILSVFTRKLSARWRYALWLVVILFAAIFVPMGTMRGPAAAGNAGSDQKNLLLGEPPAPPVCLSYVEDTAEGKKSLGGSGHAVRFNRNTDARFVESVQIFASRYGYPEPPHEDFHVYILNGEKDVLADLKYPYSMVERGELKWYTLKTPSVEVPEEFYIALSFNPHQTKGIYLGKDESVSESHSFTGLPDRGFEEIAEKYDWMIRVHMNSDTPATSIDVDDADRYKGNNP
jgi:hypothetical protein